MVRVEKPRLWSFFFIFLTVLIFVSRPASGQILGDLDGDGQVCMTDLNIILAARNTPANGPDDPRDLDGDGMITAYDARKLVILCSKPMCECVEVPDNNPPIANPGGPYSADLGEAITFDGSDSSDPDNDPLTFSWDFGDGATGTGITPTHTYSSDGTFNVTLTVNDGQGGIHSASTIAIIIPVGGNHPPLLDSISDQTISEGEPLGFIINGSDPDEDPLTFTAPELPPGAEFDQNTRTFSWTPGYDQEGSHKATFMVTDPGGLSHSIRINITVNNTNRKPSLEPITDQTVAEGDVLTFTVIGSDPDGDSLTFTAPELPHDKDATFDPNTQIFSWTPTYEDSGSYSTTFTATDPGGLSDSVQIDIIVNNTNRQPILEPVTDQTIAEGDTLTFTLNGSDPDEDPLTYTVIPLPDGADLNPTTGEFSWTPIYDQLGYYTLTFTAKDPEALSDSIQVDITVITLNQPPFLDPVPDQTIEEGDTLTFSVIGSDPDGDPLIFTVTELPPGASFDPNTRTFSWTPTYDQSATYNVTFTVTDGKESAQQEAKIIVTDVNRAPKIITTELPPGQVDQDYKGTVAAQDDDGDSLSFVLMQSPDEMSINNTSGKLSWRPDIEKIGDHSVLVRVDDGRGGTDAKQYTISVPDTIPPSIFINAPKEAIPGESFTVTAKVSDNIAVSSVILEANNNAPVEFSNPPYQLQINLPAVLPIGSSVAVIGRAIDSSNNQTEAAAIITIVGAPDIQPPEIIINVPSEVTQGKTVIISASASDNVGISIVRFFVDNDPIVSVSDPNPSIEYQVPADAPVGNTLVFMAEAVDFSGNTASTEGASTINDVPDTTAPEVTMNAPQTVEEKTSLSISVDTPDDTDVAKVDIYVNHILVATYTKPPEGEIEIPLPPSLDPGMNALVEVIVTDHAGNETSQIEMISITEPTQGVITGEVYNDHTGLPLEEAQVIFQSTDGTETSTLTDSQGQYAIVARSGNGRLIISKENFTRVERIGLEIDGNTAIEVFDARLTPLSLSSSNVSGILGGLLKTPFNLINAGFAPILNSKGMDISTLSPADIELHIPSGALNQNKNIALTLISPQGTQGLLPCGWSPIGVIDITPHHVAFNNTASLTIPNILEFGLNTGIILATWDENAGVWRAHSEATFSGDGLSINAAVSASGQFAFLVPDQLPQQPSKPAAGDILQGIAQDSIPDQAVTLITPQPKIIFYKPGVRSDVGVKVTPDTSPVSSGTPIWAMISEEYNFYSGGKLVPAYYIQDVVLFAYNEFSLFAAYPVSPSEDFEALTLEKGIITVDVIAPRLPRELSVIGSEGGMIMGPGGESLTVPANAVENLISVNISTLSEVDLGITLPVEFDFLGGISLSFAGNCLKLPAILTVPVPPFHTDGAQILLVKLQKILGENQLALVGAGKIENGEIVSIYDLLDDGSVVFEGILEGGRYLFLQTETSIGFAGGKVYGTTGDPLSGAFVTSDTFPIAALSFEDGDYISAVATGLFTLTALDTIKMDIGTAPGTIPEEGAFVPTDISMQEEPPWVVSISPEDGEENVALSSSVKVQFSEPLNPATVTNENILLTGPGGPVAGSISLRSNNTLIVFRPAEPLSANTGYTFTISDNIQDMAGYHLESTLISTFTSLDTIPPPPPPAGTTNATIPDEEGKTTISATQGTVGIHDIVSIINKTKGTSIPVLQEPDGSFTVNVEVDLVDEVLISIKDPAGNETIVPIERFQNPDGSTVIGPKGGLLKAINDVIINIPPGAFPNGAVVRITPLYEDDIVVSPGPDYPFIAGFSIESSEQPQIYIDASAPVPPGTSPDARGLVAQLVEIYSGPALAIVDTAKIIDGRLTTSSPPCQGIKELEEYQEKKIAHYAMFLDENEKMLLGQALAGINTPASSRLVYEPYMYIGAFLTAINPFIAINMIKSYMQVRSQSICVPIPKDQPIKVTVKDADTGELIDELDIPPTPADEIVYITHKDTKDKISPAVIDVKPIHKMLGVNNKSIQVLFSESISPESSETVQVTAEVENGIFEVFDGEVRLSENNCLLEFWPKRLLPMGKNYRLDLEGIKDIAGNPYTGPPIFFTTFKPYVVFPAKGKLSDLTNVGPNTSFTDVDFITKSQDESYDGKWHTELLAITGEKLFTIDASDPTAPRILGSKSAFGWREVRFLDDAYIKPREGAYDPSGLAETWKSRDLNYLGDDPSIHICTDANSSELKAWEKIYCQEPGACETKKGGCGDLAVTIGGFGIWSYDITDRTEPIFIMDRLLAFYDPSIPNPWWWVSTGFGVSLGMDVMPGMDIHHQTQFGELDNLDTVGAYVAMKGMGIYLVDVGLNLPLIFDIEREDYVNYPPAMKESTGVFSHLYYWDVDIVGGKVVAIAGDFYDGTNIRTLEIFRPDLIPTGIVELQNFPEYLTTVSEFPVYTDGNQLLWYDLAFVTGREGGISIVEIPPDGGNPLRIGFVRTPSGVETRHVQIDRKGRVAYVAASGIEDGSGKDHLLVIDVSEPLSSPIDVDNDQWDDRIIGKIPLDLPDFIGPVYLNGFRLDTKRGLIYAGISAGGYPLAVIKVRECPDVGIDFKAKNEPLPPLAIEKIALQKVIKQGLTEAQALCGIDLDSITMIEQGSGACLWKGIDTCGDNYQPGISDHDLEVFFPEGTDDGTKDCVIEALYRQVFNFQSDPIPIEVNGYKVVFDDILFFPMIRENFEKAELELDRPDGKYREEIGDMGLGRQQLLLKWLLEGIYVEVPGLDLSGKDFQEIFIALKEPWDVDGDGEEDEATHIPRLEGYESARLQELMVYLSGALIRIKGAEESDTTLQKTFKKELHKVAKAAIRAVSARIIANDTGNLVALDLNLNSPTCLDTNNSYDPYEWDDSVPCDSFEHHVASVAARIVRDHSDLNLFSVEDIKNKIYRFYRVKAGKDEIISEEEANEFISMAMEFVEDVCDSGEVNSIYNETIFNDPRGSQRQENMEVTMDLIDEHKASGKKKIIPRVFNKGGEDMEEDEWVRMYIRSVEKEKEKAYVEAGDYIHLDTRKDPPPLPEDPLDKERDNVPVFELVLDQSDLSQQGWMSFLIDIPEKNIQEPDRKNNWAKLFYYVLDTDNPSPPSLPEEPQLTEIIGKPEADLLEPEPVCACDAPMLRVTQTIDGSDSKTIYIGGPCAEVKVFVENLSTQTLKDIRLYSTVIGVDKMQLIDKLPPGGTKLLTYNVCPGDEPDYKEGQILAFYKDEDAISRGLGSNLLRVNIRCPIAVVSLDPNPNPDVSEVMYGGKLCRYYQVVDLSKDGEPVTGITVKATFRSGNSKIERSYKTNEEGFVVTTEPPEDPNGPEIEVEGMCIPWETWTEWPEIPIDSPYPIEADLKVQDSWLKDQNTCGEYVSFNIALKRFEFEEAIKAGATSDFNGSIKGLGATLRDASNIDLCGSGYMVGEQQTFDKLSLIRRGTYYTNVGLGFKFSLFKAKAGKVAEKLSEKLSGSKWKADVDLLELTAEYPVISYSGGRYDYPIAVISSEQKAKLRMAGLFLYSLLWSPPSDTGLANYKILNNLFNKATEGEEPFDLKFRESWIVGQWLRPKVGLDLISVSFSPGGDKNGKFKVDLKAAVGVGLGINFEEERISTKWGPNEIPAPGTGKKNTILKEEVVGEFDGGISLGLGLQQQLAKIAGIKEENYIKLQYNKLMEASGGISDGVKIQLTLDVDKALLPEKLDVIFSGKKEFGLKAVGEQLISLGDGSQLQETYSITNLKEIKKIAQEMGEYSALLDDVRKAQLNIEESPEVSIGPSLLMLHLMDFLYLVKNNATYCQTKEKGKTIDHPMGDIELKIAGTGLGSGETLKADHSISYIKKRTVIKNSKEYLLENYTDTNEPVLGALKPFIETINETTVDQTKDVFDGEEHNFDEQTQTGKWDSNNSSHLTLYNRQDYDSVLGLLSFRFEGFSGPFQPYRYSPEDMIGSADKPHYGIGGFHEYYPVRQTLSSPATLVLDYDNTELAGFDEGSLAIYAWDYDEGDWKYIGGDPDTENNLVTAEITQLGAYTLAPAMPGGDIQWEDQQTTKVGENIRVSLTSGPVFMNNGDLVADGVIFHVVSVAPFALENEEFIPLGSILSEDINIDMEGVQVAVENGQLQVELEYPEFSTAARIIVFADIGTTFGDTLISLAIP